MEPLGGIAGVDGNKLTKTRDFLNIFLKKYSHVHFERDGEVDEVEVDVVKPKVAQGLPGKLK